MNSFAAIAQLVEQGTENPRVGGSSPSLGTRFARRIVSGSVVLSKGDRSSAGRAPRSQCGGQGFDPPRFHPRVIGALSIRYTRTKAVRPTM